MWKWLKAHDPVEIGRLAIIAALGAVLVERLAAIAADLQLWGDGAYFVVGTAANRGYFFWFHDFKHDFFRSRIFTLLTLQAPMIVASRLGLHSLSAISKIYGVTLYSHALICLWICSFFTPRRWYLVFPMLGLFAGAMNLEGYMATDSPFLSSLYWPILFILLFAPKLSRGTLAVLVLLSIPTLIAYETMMFFGLVFAGACLLRWRRLPEERPVLAGLALWYLAGVGMAVASAIWPFDPGNKSTFVHGLIDVFRSDHLAAHVSTLVLACFAGILLVPARFPKAKLLFLGVGLLAVLFQVKEILLGHAPAGLDIQNAARTFNLLIPLAATGILGLVVLFKWVTLDRRTLGWSALLVGALGVGQAFWGLACSARWSGFMATLRAELATHEGPIPIEDSMLSRERLGPLPLIRLEVHWTLPSLSIYASEKGDVKSIVWPWEGSLMPYDPSRSASLPDLSWYGVHYDSYDKGLEAYRKAEAKSRIYALGETISMRRGGNAAKFLRDGWSFQEEWARWGKEQDFGLQLPMETVPSGPVTLEAEIFPLLAKSFPRSTADISINGVVVGQWSFDYVEQDQTRQVKLRVPGEVLAKANPVDIRFHMHDPLRSPEELGLSNEKRKLALAFVSLRLAKAE